VANQCSEPGCAGKVVARGLCQRDYQRRWRRRALPRWWDRPASSPVTDPQYLQSYVEPYNWVRPEDW
jgi:hypothetical protein